MIISIGARLEGGVRKDKGERIKDEQYCRCSSRSTAFVVPNVPEVPDVPIVRRCTIGVICAGFSRPRKVHERLVKFHRVGIMLI